MCDIIKKENDDILIEGEKLLNEENDNLPDFAGIEFKIPSKEEVRTIERETPLHSWRTHVEIKVESGMNSYGDNLSKLIEYIKMTGFVSLAIYKIVFEEFIHRPADSLEIEKLRYREEYFWSLYMNRKNEINQIVGEYYRM